MRSAFGLLSCAALLTSAACTKRAPVPGDAGPAPSVDVVDEAGADAGIIPAGTLRLLALTGDHAIVEAGWIAGHQVIAHSRHELWRFDPTQPDRAEVISFEDSGMLTTVAESELFTVSRDALPPSPLGVHVFRGLTRVRTFETPNDGLHRFLGSHVAPDAEHLLLWTGGPDTGPTVRVANLVTGTLEPEVRGFFGSFDSTSRYLLAGSSIYSVEGAHPVFEPPRHAGSPPVRVPDAETWIDRTAFVFSRAGVDAWDSASDTTRWVRLPCPAGVEPADDVDPAHSRTVRSCGSSLYVVSWPGGSFRRLPLAEPIDSSLYVVFVFTADDSFVLDAAERQYRVDPIAGTVRRLARYEPPQSAFAAFAARSEWCVRASGRAELPDVALPAAACATR